MRGDRRRSAPLKASLIRTRAGASSAWACSSTRDVGDHAIMRRGGGSSESSARVAYTNTGSQRAARMPASSQQKSTPTAGIAGGIAMAKSADASPLQPSADMQGPSGRDGSDEAHREAVLQPSSVPSCVASPFWARARQHGGRSSDPAVSRGAATAEARRSACSCFARMNLASSEGRTDAGGSTPRSMAHWIRSCSVWQQQFDQHSWALPQPQAHPSQGKRSVGSPPVDVPASRRWRSRLSIIRGDGSTPTDAQRNATTVEATISIRPLELR